MLLNRHHRIVCGMARHDDDVDDDDDDDEVEYFKI